MEEDESREPECLAVAGRVPREAEAVQRVGVGPPLGELGEGVPQATRTCPGERREREGLDDAERLVKREVGEVPMIEDRARDVEPRGVDGVVSDVLGHAQPAPERGAVLLDGAVALGQALVDEALAFVEVAADEELEEATGVEA